MCYLNLIFYYGILLVPLIFWWSWQISSVFAWICILVCFFMSGFSYQLAKKQNAKKYKNDINPKLQKYWDMFTTGYMPTLVFLLLYLIPNFFTFWMYCSKTNFIVWIAIIAFPFLFSHMKKMSPGRDVDTMKIINSRYIALIFASVLSLLTIIQEYFLPVSEVTAQSGADIVLSSISWLALWWSKIVNSLLSFVCLWLPWSKIFVSLFYNTLSYFGLFYVLSLMFYSIEKLGKKFNKSNAVSQLKSKKMIVSFTFFVLICFVALLLTKDGKNMSEKDYHEIQDKTMNVLNISDGRSGAIKRLMDKYRNSNPDDIRCGFRKYIPFLNFGCDVLDDVADVIEEMKNE